MVNVVNTKSMQALVVTALLASCMVNVVNAEDMQALVVALTALAVSSMPISS